MTKEALKLALEALECALSDDKPYIVQCKEAITAIKEALAQPKQELVATKWLAEMIMSDCGFSTEYKPLLDRIIGRIETYDQANTPTQPEQNPVATVTSETGDSDVTMSWWHEPALPVGTPLYTTPPQRKPLTDEEIEDVWANCSVDWDDTINVLTLARAIEAKLRSKND